jgi:hypothetical protein
VRLARVEIDGAFLFHSARQGNRQPHDDHFVLTQEILTQPDVLIGQIRGLDRRKLLMLARGPQMLAIERAIDRVLALGRAAHRANFTADARTIPARAFFLADLAGNTQRRISLSYHRDMIRTDLYIKVELALDDKEKPERVASEICRMIRKVYGVRSAEVSSIIEKD